MAESHALLRAPVVVRRAGLTDLDVIVPLFDGYRQFYGQPSEPDRVRAFLKERLAQGDSVLLMAEADGLVLGFTQLYPSFSSVSMAPIFILNDLFVVPETRRSGWPASFLMPPYATAARLAPSASPSPRPTPTPPRRRCTPQPAGSATRCSASTTTAFPVDRERQVRRN